MFIKEISLRDYKVLNNISINLNKKENHNVFPVISENGKGKSTLLQIIFSFLHCAFRENRHQYLMNMLEYYGFDRNENEMTKIIDFQLEHNGEEIDLSFFYCSNAYKNFNPILDLNELRDKRDTVKRSVEELGLLKKLKNEITNSNMPTVLVRRELEPFVTNKRDHELIRIGKESQLEFILKTIKTLEDSLISDEELNTLIIKAEAEKNILEKYLEEQELQYAFHFNAKNNVLLFKSNANNDKLKEISDRIYLATPNTQVLQFLSTDQLSSLFSNEKYLYSSYLHFVNEAQENLDGLFTYDFSAINLIIDAFTKARDNDFRDAMETGKYGNQFRVTSDELNKLLHGKTITINPDFKGVTFKMNDSDVTLNPKDLSHGELKKLSIYIWLKAKTFDDSVILMDEVDMGLHPLWQHELYSDLQSWSHDDQFIVATHSPQIISKAFYKNLVVLKQTTEGATADQFNKPPIESDLNTIVKTIMGGEYLPRELLELRKEYRDLFDRDNLNTPEANRIKKKILEYERENSSFFKEIEFLKELL